MRLARRRARRGFSLVELMVALVVSTFAVAGALALLASQQRIFQTSSADRAIQETARVALSEITGNLRLTGFGLEPSFAFDFGPLPSVAQDRIPSGLVASVAGHACLAGVTCRDSANGPDEIVFHHRNPYFARNLTSPATTGNLTISGPLTAPLRRGQILQVVCYSGDMWWAFVTVGAEVAATNLLTVDVPLQGGSNLDFGRQNDLLLDPCFQAVAAPGLSVSAPAASAAAKVFKVERFRYFIQSYDPAGTVQPWRTAGARPYLMLDQGLFENGVPALQVVAPDVEDLQVSYLFPRSPAGSQLVGVTPGLQIANDPAGITLTAPTPAYADRLNAATRATHHPANIGAVRVAVVVRTPEQDATLTAPAEATIPASFNRLDVPGPAGHRRYRFETSTVTPNLDVRAPYFPTYSAAAADRLNVDGG
jgi:type IV pilus assembly protein PilW